MHYVVWVWAPLCFVLLALCRAAREMRSSELLFDRLLSAPCGSVLFLYSTDCDWCDQLALQLPQLEELFPEMDFLQMDGQRAKQFVQQFEIRSYPQLLAFRRAGGAEDESVRQLLTGIYRGPAGRSEMTTFLAQTAGILPQWPYSAMQPPEQLDHVDGFRALWFVTPWVEKYHEELLLGPPATSLIGRLSQRFPTLDFYLVDGSQAALADFTNSLRLCNFPTVALMAGHHVVIVELLCYDKEIRGAEMEVVGEVLEARFDWSQLKELASRFHSVYCYESVQELQRHVESRREGDGEAQACDESGEWQLEMDMRL